MYIIRKEFDTIKKKHGKDFKVVSGWFFENYMILNPAKCHHMRLGKNEEHVTFEFESISPNNSKEEVVSGLTIDNKISSDCHIENICRKTIQEICLLSRILGYLGLRQNEIILKE